MAFIEMTREGDAEGAAAELFEADQARLGYVTSLTQLFALRPSVFAAWRNLICSITENLSSRRYELATIAAARQLRSSYCMLAQPTLLCDESECPRPSPLSLRRSVVAALGHFHPALAFVGRGQSGEAELAARGARLRVELDRTVIRPRRGRALTVADLYELASWFPEHVSRLVLVAGQVGARQNVWFNVTDEMLDFGAGTLTIPAALAKSRREHRIYLTELEV